MTKAQGRADSLSFNETDGVLHFFRKPIFWSGEKQITGDKMFFNQLTGFGNLKIFPQQYKLYLDS